AAAAESNQTRSTPMSIDVQFVTAAARADLAHLWYDVLVDEQRRFLEHADHERRELRSFPPAVPQERVVVAREDGRALGSLQLICGMDGPFPDVYEDWVSISRFVAAVGPEPIVVLTHFMVAKDHRGGAIALALLAKGL